MRCGCDRSKDGRIRVTQSHQLTLRHKVDKTQHQASHEHRDCDDGSPGHQLKEEPCYDVGHNLHQCGQEAVKLMIFEYECWCSHSILPGCSSDNGLCLFNATLSQQPTRGLRNQPVTKQGMGRESVCVCVYFCVIVYHAIQILLED
ncbi:hypothetical protein AALO_G00270000 [Alosa alosa]|uniref:Uncharacterized protein n=1 Tax=Alosa alosa TaxID=278164 RepID=A0AAV6FQ72_9TELE|nr:hypothetical protein AALO_G00270000 [Alosa alosa]